MPYREKVGADAFARAPIGTGPYKDSRTATAQRIDSSVLWFITRHPNGRLRSAYYIEELMKWRTPH